MRINWKDFDEEVLVGVDLCKKIEKYGYEAYIVGGCVRDIVLWYKGGKNGDPNIHDVDIATNMPIEELYEKFKCESNNGEEHGTILVFNKNIAFEVTQFRVDGDYSDGRHPDSVKFTKSFRDDTSRRDFTINAMGIDAAGNLIDYHGGESDLDNKVLRTVGSANDRFSEDALRIIRAIRFAARFDLSIESETYEAICNLKGKIKGLAMERISAELSKSAEYGKKAFANVINVLVKSGACEYIDNEYIEWDDLKYIVNYRAKTNSLDKKLDKDPQVAMSIVLLMSKNMDLCAKKLRLDNETLRLAKFCEEYDDTYELITDDLSKSVKMVTNKYFHKFMEVMNGIGNGTPSEKDLMKVEELADEVLPLQKKITAEIAAEGISGPAFGKELAKRMEKLFREHF